MSSKNTVYTPINITKEESSDLYAGSGLLSGSTHEDDVDDIYGYSYDSYHPLIGRPLRWIQKTVTLKNFIGFLPMLLLLVVVIVLGSINRVVYKIQLVPMEPYVLFISWFLTAAYVGVYFSFFFFRWGTGGINLSMVKYATMEWRGVWKLAVMGFMDASGFVLGIFAARRLTGYLLTLLPQAIIPITMVLAVLMIGTRYGCGQIFGAIFIVYGLILSLVPDLENGGGNSSIIWAVVYFISILPNALSFILREMVFNDRPDLDIFVVNSFDSLWQFFFSILMFPLVAIPGFGGIPFSELGDFFPNGAQCIVGITPHGTSYGHRHHDWSCEGEPELIIMYIVINVSWNISLLYLLKKGGAVLTFIAAAVSLPISHLAFAIDWPLLGSEKLQYWDIIALIVVLFGLVVYRLGTFVQKSYLEKRKKRLEDAGKDDYHPLWWMWWPCAQAWTKVAGKDDEKDVYMESEDVRYY